MQEADTGKQAVIFDVERVRRDFPILTREVHGKPLVYLDNAATSQKPYQVIDAERNFYAAHNANIHRGLHLLSQEATEQYEHARARVRDFINAAESHEVIFTRGATESINLVAASWGGQNLRRGDIVLLTGMEHHANIVPWQLLSERNGVEIGVVPVDDTGALQLDVLEKKLNDRVKLVALCHASNSMGVVNPIEQVIELAHARGIPVLVDAAQSAPHLPLDVRDLDCDWLVFSGHKLLGPTGIGVLYGKSALLEAMPPYQGGGDMIERVRFSGTTFRGLPERFEAGTPNIAGAIGLAAALDYFSGLGHTAVSGHERMLLDYATERLEAIEGLTIHGTARPKIAVLSFTLREAHPADIATMLDMDGIAVRSGHHCTMPLWEHFGLEGTARASFAFYNTRDEVDRLAESLVKVKRMFG